MHDENHPEHARTKGGYIYSTPEEVAAIKAQRAAIWEWLTVSWRTGRRVADSGQ